MFLQKCAVVRAALFSYKLPLDFASLWILLQHFQQKHSELAVPVASTRDFCLELFRSKIEATIRNPGEMIGWEDDNEVVGPKASAAKESLLRLIPHILPAENEPLDLYRLVLDHGDVGTHNMLVDLPDEGELRVTSLFDWKTGCIVPALLSDPLMAVIVDLIADEDGKPSYKRDVPEDTEQDHKNFREWSTHHFKVGFNSLASALPNH